MKKFWNVFGGLLASAGFLLIIGAAGGCDQGICTGTQFFQIAGFGFLMALVGILCFNFTEE